MSERKAFGSRLVARLADITYSTLNSWAESGVLPPSIKAVKGRGTTRKYSLHDAMAAFFIGRLQRFRELSYLQLAIRAIQTNEKFKPDDLLVLHLDGTIGLFSNEETARLVKESGGIVVLTSFQSISDDIVIKLSEAALSGGGRSKSLFHIEDL